MRKAIDHGRQQNARKPQCSHVSDRRQEYRPGTDSEASFALIGLSVQTAPARAARYTGHCLSITPEGDLRQRLLLARTWMPHWASSQISTRVLEAEAGPKSRPRQAEQVGTSGYGLGCADGVAVPNQKAGHVIHKTRIVPGASGPKSDRHSKGQRVIWV